MGQELEISVTGVKAGARLLRIKQLVQLAPTATGASERLSLNFKLKELMRVRAAIFQRSTACDCQFEILMHFKFQILLARFAKKNSVRMANSEQSAMSPMCDQGISN